MTHMASSQVEIPSSAPFGCVLRDHNRRDRCNGEKNVRAAFEKNLKELVHNCISVQPDSSSLSAEDNSNLENQSDSVSSWVSVEHNKKSRIVDKAGIDNMNKREVNSMSSRQSRILDRWRHAREIVSEKIEIHRIKEAESSGLQNIGASSLVQMWEARLHRSNSSKKYTSGFEEQSKTHETGDSGDERLETQTIHDESLTDWDSRSDRTAKSEPPTLSQSRSCDAGESERVKVADIIKRLTSDDNNDYCEQHSFSAGNSPSRRRLSSGSDQAEPRGFLTQLISSPKIRGRQAFNDLIVQMERDRKQEIHLLGQSQVVSKFAQRGRIQSMLRLRFLQRGMAGNQDQLRVKPQSSPQLSRLKQASGIVHLRERFINGAMDQGTACRSSGTVTPKSLDRETTNMPDATIVETPTVDIQPSRQVSLLDQQNDATPKPDLMPIMIQVSNNNISQVATQTSDVSWKDKSLSFEGEEEEEEEEEEEAEEIEDHEHQDFLDSNYDWFSEISRPRSYWEDRRQEWYREMLNTNSANEEICRLLERRTVSSFLSSDFRDRMDELMTCRAQRQVDRTCNEQHEGDEESENGYTGGVQIHQQDCRGRDEPEDEQALGGVIDEQREEEQEIGCSRGSIRLEELDEETPTSNRYLETVDYFSQSSPSLQMQSPSPFRTWSYQSNEISDDSDRAPSVSSQQPLQCLSENRPFSSSSTNHPSLEMELICDLRGHMMQMQREMLDLRRSILSCTEMQMQLQRSMKRDINIAQREEESSLGKVLKNRRCCICYEMQVDSLLYRCGHMCTCLKCAHELQWSSGKCPMCRASIVDVVRVFLEL